MGLDELGNKAMFVNDFFYITKSTCNLSKSTFHSNCGLFQNEKQMILSKSKCEEPLGKALLTWMIVKKTP